MNLEVHTLDDALPKQIRRVEQLQIDLMVAGATTAYCPKRKWMLDDLQIARRVLETRNIEDMYRSYRQLLNYK